MDKIDMGNKALIVDDVSMKFNLGSERIDNLKEYFIKSLKRQVSFDEFWALKNVSFSLEKGERLGILGLNGAGKSTLLKVIAGVYKPTEGHVYKKGKVVPMLELGAGFDPQYTGKENIFLYGTVLGYSKSYLEEKYDEIVEFSELGKFIDVPIKNYSSGMKSKLGFSIATISDPDILILDEVLSVGDARFKKKSEAKMMEMIEGGTTVLFVSHSLEQVKSICDKAMILDHGRLSAFGDIEEVAQMYEEIVEKEDSLDKRDKNHILGRKNRRRKRRKKKLEEQQALLNAQQAANEAAKTEAANTAIANAETANTATALEANVNDKDTVSSDTNNNVKENEKNE